MAYRWCCIDSSSMTRSMGKGGFSCEAENASYHLFDVLVYALRIFASLVMLAVISFVVALGSNVGTAYAVDASGWMKLHGDSLKTPEQVRAAYLIGTDYVAEWSTGELSAPSEAYVTGKIESDPTWEARCSAWKVANFVCSSSEWANFAKMALKEDYKEIKSLAKAFTQEEWDEFIDELASEPISDLGYSRVVDYISSMKPYYEAMLYDVFYDSSLSSNYISNVKASVNSKYARYYDSVYEKFGKVEGELSAEDRAQIAGALYDDMGLAYGAKKDFTNSNSLDNG